MNEINLKKDSSGQYLIVRAPGEEKGFEMGMIENLKAKNILKPMYVYENGIKCCSYNVSGCFSLGEYLAGKVFGLDDLKAIIVQMDAAVRCMLNYLLGEDNLLMRDDCIFVDKNTKALKFCVFPGDGRRFSSGLGKILGKMLLSVDINDTDAVNLCLKMYKAACEPDSRLHDVLNAMHLENKTINTRPVFDGRSAKDSSAKSRGTFQPNAPEKARDTLQAKNTAQAKNATKLKNSSDETKLKGKSINPFKSLMQAQAKINQDKSKEEAEGEAQGEAQNEDINMVDLDDLDIDDYDDFDEIGEPSGDRSLKGTNVIKHLLVGEIILFAFFVVLFVIKGLNTALRTLPLYVFLAVCLGVYIVASDFSKRKKAATSSHIAEDTVS